MADKANGFEPRKHLLKLSRQQRRGDSWIKVEHEYLPVQWRLMWLREEHPDAEIQTQLIERDGTFALYRARVSIPNGGSATGWGSETAEDFGDFIEKAETKALGRALAALGYGTQFCTDYDEGDSVADAPVERVQPASYEGYQEAARPAPAQAVGQKRHMLRQALTAKFGGDERAAHDFVQLHEPEACGPTTINFGKIPPGRCEELTAILARREEPEE